MPNPEYRLRRGDVLEIWKEFDTLNPTKTTLRLLKDDYPATEEVLVDEVYRARIPMGFLDKLKKIQIEFFERTKNGTINSLDKKTLDVSSIRVEQTSDKQANVKNTWGAIRDFFEKEGLSVRLIPGERTKAAPGDTVTLWRMWWFEGEFVTPPPGIERFDLKVDTRGRLWIPPQTTVSKIGELMRNLPDEMRNRPDTNMAKYFWIRNYLGRFDAEYLRLEAWVPGANWDMQPSLEFLADCMTGTPKPDLVVDDECKSCRDHGANHFLTFEDQITKGHQLRNVRYHLTCEVRAWTLVDEHGRRSEHTYRSGQVVGDAVREAYRVQCGRDLIDGCCSCAYITVVPRAAWNPGGEALWGRVPSANNVMNRVLLLPGDTVFVTRRKPVHLCDG